MFADFAHCAVGLAERSLYLFIVHFADFLASGFYCEDYTTDLWRRIIRRSYLRREARSLQEPLFRDRRREWKHPRAFGLFGVATGAAG